MGSIEHTCGACPSRQADGECHGNERYGGKCIYGVLRVRKAAGAWYCIERHMELVQAAQRVAQPVLFGR